MENRPSNKTRYALACCFLAFIHISPAGGQWALVWQDEFDGTALDAAKWTAVNNCGDKRNDEQQCYMAGAVSLGSGMLTITGTSQPQGSFPYTSGAVKTGTKFTQAYGRFEFRARLPVGGQGIWPALWLYPPAQWPPEIDVLEAVNSMSTIYMTYHWGTSSNHQHDGENTAITNPQDWHVYSMEWETDEIRWYIDGAHRMTHTGPDVTSIPMQIYINLALGGSWPGPVGSSTVFPQVMQVDYVRVYRASTHVHRPVESRTVPMRGPFQSIYDLKGRSISSADLRSANRGVFIVTTSSPAATAYRIFQDREHLSAPQ